ncbi:MAG TPA: bifunctional isocitrate dehydrogenase kinase/phosphatase [Gemmatimonadaceae bacterium]|nr:bifunctional isocitrate dehydrogenase kinase/phosphatase [Gemmatimonadaceae bacterium]
MNGNAARAARAIVEVFDAYQAGMRDSARRAARHFAERDWVAARAESTRRLTLYGARVNEAIARVDAVLGASADREAWAATRDAFAAKVAGRDDCEIAETFYSSTSRQRFATVGVDHAIEFQRAWSALPDAAGDDAPTRWCAASADGGSDALAAALLARGPAGPRADEPGDRRRVAGALAAAARDAWGDPRLDGAEVLDTVFYRNREAYVVGQLRRGERAMPLVLAFRSHADGIAADAVLTTADEASIVFGFAWSYLHADLARPRATVAFLQRIMPLKRVDELYTAIGYNKHGKTELYRALMHALSQPGAHFEEAEGTKGLVMAVFTLPSLNVVLKVIKDRIAPPKSTNRLEVERQYRRVFLNDRVGRLADAQLFKGLAFPVTCFSDDLLAELAFVAPSVVRLEGDTLVIDHLYTERRVRPLNLYLREASDAEAVAAILEYGEAIRDLAASNIFPGDLLLKNFGVSRHGRVVFYDYDELATLADCNFRHLPAPRSLEDEMAAEPWFSVAENDVFPEEFIHFTVPEGPLRDAFLAAHGDLLDPDWWCAMQERARAGEVPDTFPYAAARRLGGPGG